MSSIVEQNIAILRLISRGIAEGRIGDRKIGGGAFLCNNTDGRRISFRGIMLYRTVRECAVLYADFFVPVDLWLRFRPTEILLKVVFLIEIVPGEFE